jgi:hypothetical protein
MVDDKIDIAKILSLKAGEHLSRVYEFHKEMSTHQLQDQEYFALRRKEIESCIEAVILFQASLEAIINEELESDKKLEKVKKENDDLNKKFKMLSFKNKWLRTFAVLKIDKASEKYLENYLDFYIKFRIPITHARSRYVNAEQFNFPNVYSGIKNGYLFLEKFYQCLHKFEEEHSWNYFCITCNLPLDYS